MKRILIAIAAAGLAACTHFSPTCEVLPGGHPRADEIRSAMKSRMVIPVVDLHRVSIPDALTFVRDASAEHDAEKCGVSFVLRLDAPFERRVTIVARHISVYDLVDGICRQSGLVWQITSSGVLLERRNERSDHRGLHRTPLGWPEGP